MQIPSSTYRIQLHKDFTFHHLEEILNYLHQLGISTIYASPITTAIKGSQHGYDVTNPLIINPEIGTDAGLKKLADLLKARNMNWLQDIVPNHMAFDSSNPWLRDVLERGKDSEYYRFFDIDTDHSREWTGSKIMAPFLGKTLTECLQHKELTLQFLPDGQSADPAAAASSSSSTSDPIAASSPLLSVGASSANPTSGPIAPSSPLPSAANGFVISYYDNHYPVSVSSWQWICTVADGCPPELLASLRQLEPIAQQRADKWSAAREKWIRQTTAHEEWMSFLEQRILFFNEQPALLTELINNQHYILTHGHLAASRINYRRFFTVSSLICLRMEDPVVFAAYHQQIREWVQKGYLQGLRIDHIDGLAFPREYIQTLKRFFGEDCYTVAEKILAAGEQLPENWQLEGTSGYDFLSMVNQLLTDEVGYRELIAFYRARIDQCPAYEDIVFSKKLNFLKTQMGGEWNNLMDLLLCVSLPEADKMDKPALKEALAILMASFPVYRTYPEPTPPPDDLSANSALSVNSGLSSDSSHSANSNHPANSGRSPDISHSANSGFSPEVSHAANSALSADSSRSTNSGFSPDSSHSADSGFSADNSLSADSGSLSPDRRSFPPISDADRNFIDQAFSRAASRYPAEGSAELNFLKDIFRKPGVFQTRLMQFTGPLAAKGVEDTTFYVYNPLISRNEVGDNPSIDSLSPADFHQAMIHRQAHLPHSMNATATHDTKRGEDARIRLNWLTAIPEEWIARVEKWQQLNRAFIRKDPHANSSANPAAGRTPTANDEYLIYQALLGSFPEDLLVTDVYRERVHQYLTKALREAKTNTGYDSPNEAYEKKCHDFLTAILQQESGFLEDFIPFVYKIIRESTPYTLSQTLLKLTAPGIPDIYQGAESWDLSLVDPDNRLPVDYASRKKMLAKIKEGEQIKEGEHKGAGKLFTIYKTLAYRNQHPQVFTAGAYIPVTVPGPLLSYMRRHEENWALVILPLIRRGQPIPKTLSITLPAEAPSDWINLFTGQNEFGSPTAKDGNKTINLELKGILSEFPVALLVGKSS